jgi:MerR family transcriptional regulator, light-induced transcriptional regulator
MYTIKEASHRTGVPVALLRTWERRYGIVRPRRTESGYRLYDERAIAAVIAMRRLVDDGWTPATAAAAVAAGKTSANGSSTGDVGAGAGPLAGQVRADGPGRPVDRGPEPPRLPEGGALTDAFVEAAAAVDVTEVESLLDRGFGLGTFETVVDGWLMPTLRALGDAWESGRVDVAGEHAASSAVMRRLGQSFAAASSLVVGPRVLVGLPGGALHELGALAFATAARRRGLAVVYVGADLPVASWRRAVHAFPTRVAVLGVPTADDRAAALESVRALLEEPPGIVVAAGGSHADDLHPDVVRLPCSITEAAETVEALAR